MIGYLVWKEDNGKSKKVTFKFIDGTEQKYLVNGIDDFSQIPLNKVYEYTTDGTWRNFEIINSMVEVIEGEDYDTLMSKYGPKKIPKLMKTFEMMVDYINKTPDKSNVNGYPRQVTVEQFKNALTAYLSDDDGVNRLAKLTICPASTKSHDNQEGGLLRHIYKMTKLYVSGFADTSEDEFCRYDDYPLMMCIGILVHDLGKLDQYNYNPELQTWEYNEESSRYGGHLGYSVERWCRKGREFCDIFRVEIGVYWEVLHMIMSHHGNTSTGFGSFVNPMTRNAYTLHCIDFMESRQTDDANPPEA